MSDDEAQRAHLGETYREGENYAEASDSQRAFYDALFEAEPVEIPGDYSAGFTAHPWRRVGWHVEAVLPMPEGPTRYRLPEKRTHINPRAGWGKDKPLVFQYPWESEGYELGYRFETESVMRGNRGSSSVSWEENEEDEQRHHRESWDFPTVLDTTWRASGNRPGARVRGETDEALAHSRFMIHLNGGSSDVAIVALALEGFNTATIAAVAECSRRTVQRVIGRAKRARVSPNSKGREKYLGKE